MESELAAIMKLMEQATAAGDSVALAALLEKKERICEMLTALEQSFFHEFVTKLGAMGLSALKGPRGADLDQRRFRLDFLSSQR